MKQRQLPLWDGVGLRDKALQKVSKNASPFIGDALAWFDWEKPTGEVTGEGIRVALTTAKITPHHHNAWGALVMTLVRREYLQPTDRFVGMQDPRSHARATRVYLWTFSKGKP